MSVALNVEEIHALEFVADLHKKNVSRFLLTEFRDTADVGWTLVKVQHTASAASRTRYAYYVLSPTGRVYEATHHAWADEEEEILNSLKESGVIVKLPELRNASYAGALS